MSSLTWLPQNVVAKIMLLGHSFEYDLLPLVSLHYLLFLGPKTLPQPSAGHYHHVSIQPIASRPYCQPLVLFNKLILNMCGHGNV